MDEVYRMPVFQPRRKKSKAAAQRRLASQKKVEEFNNQKHWVQCNLCDKWRVLPPGIEFDVFECVKNQWDPERASCEAPEEEWCDDEGESGDTNNDKSTNPKPKNKPKTNPKTKTKKKSSKKRNASSNEEVGTDQWQPLHPYVKQF